MPSLPILYTICVYFGAHKLEWKRIFFHLLWKWFSSSLNYNFAKFTLFLLLSIGAPTVQTKFFHAASIFSTWSFINYIIWQKIWEPGKHKNKSRNEQLWLQKILTALLIYIAQQRQCLCSRSGFSWTPRMHQNCSQLSRWNLKVKPDQRTKGPLPEQRHRQNRSFVQALGATVEDFLIFNVFLDMNLMQNFRQSAFSTDYFWMETVNVDSKLRHLSFQINCYKLWGSKKSL